MEKTQQFIQGDKAAPAELAEFLTRASWRLKKNERKELTPFGLTFAQASASAIWPTRSRSYPARPPPGWMV
jgi:hypothetical protein